MNKKIIYLVLVILIIVGFTIVWNNSQNKKDREVNDENTNTQVKIEPKLITPTDTISSINKDLDSINVDSGIDTDLKILDTNVKTL